VASGPDRPPAGPSRLAGRLARHRWVSAAGMTATVAVVAGGGLALALHESSSGPPKECGLVPCAAALPASVQSTGDESASAPATAAPTASKRTATPPSPVASPTTSPAASAAAPGASTPGAPAPGASAPAGPGMAGPGAAPGSAAGAAPSAGPPAFAGRVSVPEPRSACTTVIAFTARGALSTPVRCTFTVVAVRHRRSRDGSGHPGSGPAGQHSDRAGGQLRLGRSSHDGRLGSWLSGWLSRGWSGAGWSGGGWPGGGQSGGGWPGQRGGWPGGR
jgi:hypothetical protein